MSQVQFTLESYKGIGMVLVQNSSIGSIITGPGFNITVMDSYIAGSERIQETLLKVENSSILLRNCTFLKNTRIDGSKSIILKAKAFSYISIENCFFLNNTGQGNVITAENGTTVHVGNSIFRSNVIVKDLCTIFSISSSSSLAIADSEFSDNFAPAGGILRLNDSTASVTASLFLNNMAFWDGVYFIRNSTFRSSNCTYAGNIASSKLARRRYNIPASCIIECTTTCEEHGPCMDEYSNSGVYFAKDYTALMIINDTYISNAAEKAGGLMLLANVTLQIYNSIIEKTIALQEGVIYGKTCNATFINCAFTQNFGSDVVTFTNAHVDFKSSQFNGNIGRIASCLKLFGSNMSIEESKFSKNVQRNHNGGPLFTNDTSVSIYSSSFSDNTGGI